MTWSQTTWSSAQFNSQFNSRHLSAKMYYQDKTADTMPTICDLIKYLFVSNVYTHNHVATSVSNNWDRSKRTGLAAGRVGQSAPVGSSRFEVADEQSSFDVIGRMRAVRERVRVLWVSELFAPAHQQIVHGLIRSVCTLVKHLYIFTHFCPRKLFV